MKKLGPFLIIAAVFGCSDGSETQAGVRDSSEGGASSVGGSQSGAGGGEGSDSGGGGTSTGGQPDGTASGGEPADPPVTFTLGETTVYSPEKDKEYTAKTLGPVEGRASLSQYGGDLSRNAGATGFFRTTRIDGNWFFVDPDGYLYLSIAVNSVVEGGGIELPEALQEMGFNGLANWSDFESINSGDKKLPYTTKYSFLSKFTGDDSYDGGTLYLEGLLEAGVLPVVFDDFDAFCGEFAAQIAEFKDDPWMVGIFSDNELPFYDGSGSYGDVLDRWMNLATDDAYYGYAKDWLEARGSSADSYGEADKADFTAHIVEIYYSKVSRAIKEVDSNHLYIGTRFHGAAKRQANVMAAAGPYVDVVSINHYGEWIPDPDNMDMWLRETGKPFLISEFYVKGADAGLGNADGAGWEVETQEDRGAFYTNWHLNFYAHPGAVGTHWFRYIDKPGQDSNKGLISEQYEWYTPLVDEVRNTNRQIYQLVEFLR